VYCIDIRLGMCIPIYVSVTCTTRTSLVILLFEKSNTRHHNVWFPYTTGKSIIVVMSLVTKKRKIVTDNRYSWRAQKNSSPICSDLVSAAPNNDTRNKNASLEVRSVVVLGSGKRQWPRYFASVMNLEHSDDDGKIIVCRCFRSITTDDLVFSFVTS
jgi:hypothetical protein